MLKSKEELIAFAYQVLSDEFGFEAENYDKQSLVEMSHLLSLIVSQKESK